MKKSLSRDIPWNLYNGLKLLLHLTLVIYTIVDLSIASVRRRNGEEIFDVDIVTPIIKLLTFVSLSFKIRAVVDHTLFYSA